MISDHCVKKKDSRFKQFEKLCEIYIKPIAMIIVDYITPGEIYDIFTMDIEIFATKDYIYDDTDNKVRDLFLSLYPDVWFRIQFECSDGYYIQFNQYLGYDDEYYYDYINDNINRDIIENNEERYCEYRLLEYIKNINNGNIKIPKPDCNEDGLNDRGFCTCYYGKCNELQYLFGNRIIHSLLIPSLTQPSYFVYGIPYLNILTPCFFLPKNTETYGYNILYIRSYITSFDNFYVYNRNFIYNKYNFPVNTLYILEDN